MRNISTAKLVAHDERAHASWLTWHGVADRVPLATAFQIGSTVAWAIPSEQVRLPSRSGKPVRDSDTEFPARLLAVGRHGNMVDVVVDPLGTSGHPLVMTVPAEIAARNGIREGDELVLRLRGESIKVMRPADAPANS